MAIRSRNEAILSAIGDGDWRKTSVKGTKPRGLDLSTEVEGEESLVTAGPEYILIFSVR